MKLKITFHSYALPGESRRTLPSPPKWYEQLHAELTRMNAEKICGSELMHDYTYQIEINTDRPIGNVFDELLPLSNDGMLLEVGRTP